MGIGQYEGTRVNGQTIVITTEQGELIGGNWIAANGLPPTNSTSATMANPSSTDCPLTSTTLELSGAGHVDFSDNAQCLPNLIQGSSAGDVIIGSTANANGVERIDVKMDEGSWLSALASTNEALRMVTVEGRDIDGDGKAENGSLFIGDWNGRGSLKGDGSASTWTDAASLLSSGANAGVMSPALLMSPCSTGLPMRETSTWPPRLPLTAMTSTSRAWTETNPAWATPLWMATTALPTTPARATT